MSSHVFANDPVSAGTSTHVPTSTTTHVPTEDGPPNAHHSQSNEAATTAALTSHPLAQANTETSSYSNTNSQQQQQQGGEPSSSEISQEKQITPNGTSAANHHRFEYAGNPLSHYWTNTKGELVGPNESNFNPGYASAVAPRRFANAAPLGLSGFAFTTFLLSIINLNTRGIATPNIVVGPALAYGGLIQLLAGMWEVAAGNTFAAWALSSYGGFWISLGITFTPGGFGVAEAYGGADGAFYTALGFYVMGWFIFTFFVFLATLRSTFAFSFLLFTVDLAFLTLAAGYIANDQGTAANGVMASPDPGLNLAGGAFGIIAAFTAWWIMLEGIQDSSNSFFTVPMFHYPWSRKGRPPGYMDADIEALEGSEKHDAWKSKNQ